MVATDTMKGRVGSDKTATSAPAGDRNDGGQSSLIARTNLLIFYAALLIAWEVLIPYFDVPRYIAPTPSSVVMALYIGLVHGLFLTDLGVTMFETLTGFAIAATGGVVMGALIVEVRFIERAIYPLLVAIQSIPKIAMAPLLLIWIGFGIKSKIAMAALIAFFPMLINTVNGLRAYERDMHELFDSLAASRFQKLIYLKIPSAIPFLVAGLDVSFIFALLGSIVGEFVGASAGLGYTIIQLQFQLDTAGVFAVLVLLGLIGVTGHTIISYFGKRAAFWQAVNIAAS